MSAPILIPIQNTRDCIVVEGKRFCEVVEPPPPVAAASVILLAAAVLAGLVLLVEMTFGLDTGRACPLIIATGFVLALVVGVIVGVVA